MLCSCRERRAATRADRAEGSVRSYIAVVSSCCEVSGSVQVMNATPMRRKETEARAAAKSEAQQQRDIEKVSERG